MKRPAALAWACVVACWPLAPAHAQGDATPKATVAQTGFYQLDAERSRLVARVRVGLWRYPVRFTSLDGGLVYDPAKLQGARVHILVDAKSADTPDRAYRGAVVRLFEASRYPQVQFASTAVEPRGDGGGQLSGALTLHGVTRPVTFTFSFDGENARPDSLRFTGRGRIRRSDFGMQKGGMLLGDEVDLSFAVTFIKASGSQLPLAQVNRDDVRSDGALVAVENRPMNRFARAGN